MLLGEASSFKYCVLYSKPKTLNINKIKHSGWDIKEKLETQLIKKPMKPKTF